MRILALDIGGANIKVSNGLDYAASYAFALWKSPDRLTARLCEILACAPPTERIVATMTGELADCYPSKREGVAAIVASLVESAGPEVEVYLINGSLVGPTLAKEQYRLAAASNWHALARFAARFAHEEPAILVDVGSTTCDVIPLVGSTVAATGRTDTERLLAHELVYTGIERTPVCSVVEAVPYRGQTCPIARELFATMLDVYLVLDKIPETTNADTADGRPATRKAAIARLARCLCADEDEFGCQDAMAMADYIAKSQAESLGDAVAAVVNRLDTTAPQFIFAGHGAFLFLEALRLSGLPSADVFRLDRELGVEAARCASAYALARLAAELPG